MVKKNCEFCGGSGQISYFKGVSRFLVSWEECPECAGLGYIIPETDGMSQPDEPDTDNEPSAKLEDK